MRRRRFILPASAETRWFVYHPHRHGIGTLMRVGFKFRGRKLLLHHFRPHQEDKFHNHPWDFRTIILWGGYTDESIVDGAVVRDTLIPLSHRRRSATHTHRTSCSAHTFTLVYTNARRRNWCEGTLGGSWYCDGEVDDFDATLGRRDPVPA